MKASTVISHPYAQRLQHNAIRLGQLLIWTLYDHPLDYPEWFVARPHIILPKLPTAFPMHLMARDLETLRRALPNGLVRMERLADDDPCIIETWV